MAEMIRQMGISEQVLYRWKRQDKESETDQVHQCKQVQKGNAMLKTMLRDVLAKEL